MAPEKADRRQKDDEQDGGYQAASRYVDSRFQIQTGQVLADLSSPFANAYAVSDTKTKAGQDRSLYALVFEKGFPVRKRAAERLRKQRFASMVNVLDAGKVVLPSTKAERYGVILERPTGIPLSTYITRDTLFTDVTVVQGMLPQVVEALEYLHEQDIVHGRINPSNITYDPATERVLIGECLSSFCGYAQDIAYESLERSSCHRAGKGSVDLSTDYYALGATILFMLTGARPVVGADDPQILRNRFERGSYYTAMMRAQDAGLTRIVPRLEMLLKGLMTDNLAERWQINELRDWLKRKDVPAANVGNLKKFSGFSFDGKEYTSLRYLAYDIGQKWSEAKKFIKIPDLARWIKIGPKDDALATRIEALHGSIAEIVIPDERLSKLVQLIDPEGPIRYQNLSCSICGIGGVFAYAHLENERELVQNAANLFQEGLIENWINNQAEPENYSVGVLNWSPTAIKQYLRKSQIGFGPERALYALNPDVACQSPLLGEAYATDLHEALVILDRSAGTKDSSDPMDRHLAAFICQKIGIHEEIRVKALQNFPSLANSMAVQMLGLLSVAQNHSHASGLKNLAKWVDKRLQATLDILHSKYIKRDLRHRIDREVKDGNLNGVFQVIADPTYIRRDTSGYSEAKRQYYVLAKKAYETQAHSNIERMSYHLGLRFAVMMAYVVCIASFILLFYKIS